MKTDFIGGALRRCGERNRDLSLKCEGIEIRRNDEIVPGVCRERKMGMRKMVRADKEYRGSNEYRHSIVAASIWLVSPCRKDGGGKENPSFGLVTATHHFQRPTRTNIVMRPRRVIQ